MDTEGLLAMVTFGVMMIGVAIFAVVKIRAERKGVLKPQEQWSAVVTGFSFSTVRTGGPYGNSSTEHVAVHFQRDDGGVGEVRISDSNEGGGLFGEVMAYWQEGDRIEKRAGQRYPRRIPPLPFVATIQSIDRNVVTRAAFYGGPEPLEHVAVVYGTDDGHLGVARFFAPLLVPGVPPPVEPVPNPAVHHEVITDWQPGDRIAQAPGEHHPHRIARATDRPVP